MKADTSSLKVGPWSSLTSRQRFNWLCGVTAALLAIVSLIGAVMSGANKDLGKMVVALWILVPPVFFWMDWVVFCSKLAPKEKDAAKHTHDLSRNIWLGLVVVLTAGFQLNDLF